ncbi:hypothetical protein [Pseudomonas orientalis]|uniref:hypothetical protein n=1 Tax=Pseudomonas orientalis TaxID=76758 RepID=UPI002FE1D03C
MSAANLSKAWTVETWMLFLWDESALLKHPGAHHKTLLLQAHELHRAQLIERDELCDLLELADSALAYAVETRLEESGNV